MLLAEFIKSSTSALEELYPSNEARAIVIDLCRELLGIESYTHIIEPATQISEYKIEQLLSCIERLKRFEPIQYVLGYSYFRSHRFQVSPSVLIPRPETEQLVDIALKDLPKGAKVLDLCTGSGCIAWSIALERPDTEVFGLDISEEALNLAKSQKISEVNIPQFFLCDVLKCSLEKEFDIIVSNPPYIMDSEKPLMRKNVLDYEPSLALFVPDNDPLLFYKAIASWAKNSLKKGGIGIVEVNEMLGTQTMELFRKAKMSKVEIINDFWGKQRFVKIVK